MHNIQISTGPHPCGEEGRCGVNWQGASIDADTQEELNLLVEKFILKFWHPWIIGTNNESRPSAFMFKPIDCRCEWLEPNNLDKNKLLSFADQNEVTKITSKILKKEKN